MFGATKFSVARFQTSEAPEVEGLRCVRVMVPDDDSYVRILAAMVAEMTRRTNWEGEQTDRTTRANLCEIGYYNTDWGGCVNCDEVADCIENDEGVQDAITDIINANSGFPAEFPYGQNLPTSYTSSNLAEGTNPTCDLGILWAQCLAITMVTNDAIVDTLEKVEASANAVEFANAALSSIPLVATAKNLAGIDGALDMVNYYQEAVLEGYQAQYTVTPGGVQDQIACALFCACKADCEITIDRIIGVLQVRLAVYVAPPSLAGFVDFIETLAGVNQDTTFVVDLAFFVAWGAIKTANFFFGQVYNGILELIIALAVDEASPDWALLCDCPEQLCAFYDLTASDFDFVPGDGFGSSTEYASGIGFRSIIQPGQFVDVMRDVVPDAPAPAIVEVHFDAATTYLGTGAVYLFLDGVTVSSDIFAVPSGSTGYARPISYTGLFDRIQFQQTAGTLVNDTVITGLTIITQPTADMPAWLADAEEC